MFFKWSKKARIKSLEFDLECARAHADHGWELWKAAMRESSKKNRYIEELEMENQEMRQRISALENMI